MCAARSNLGHTHHRNQTINALTRLLQLEAFLQHHSFERTKHINARLQYNSKSKLAHHCCNVSSRQIANRHCFLSTWDLWFPLPVDFAKSQMLAFSFPENSRGKHSAKLRQQLHSTQSVVTRSCTRNCVKCLFPMGGNATNLSVTQ